MSETLWTLPVPASALLWSPVFAPRAKRQCELSLAVEGDGGETRIVLLFNNVEAYKCTYGTSCGAEMIRAAYGRLVRLGATPWLSEVMAVYSRSSRTPKELQHLMICFDDGPCYEIVCDGWAVESRGA